MKSSVKPKPRSPSTMSVNSRFRIRGLAEVPDSIEPNPPNPAPSKAVELADLRTKEAIPWHKTAQATPAPHIWQTLYGYDQVELGKLWPTFAFMNSRAPRPIKETPLALGEFLDDEVKEPGLRDILREYSSQQEEQQNLRDVVEYVLNDEGTLQLNMTPVASAFAATFLRGSSWLRQGRDEILEKIASHPVAAYIALQSGVWQNEKDRLVEGLTADPYLLLTHWQTAKWGDWVEPDLVLAALAQAPHLYWMRANTNALLPQDEAWKNLLIAAKEKPMAAAFALGLQPNHELAEPWKRLVKTSPSAMYWAVRVGGVGGNYLSLPYWGKFRELVAASPRWCYHWCRDFEPGEAYYYAGRHWPDPWAVELVRDLTLAPDWVLHQYQDLKLETAPEDPLLKAILFFTLNYTQNADEDE